MVVEGSNKSGVPQDQSERARIDKLIEEASKGGRFYQHQLRRQEILDQKIHLALQKLHKATESEKRRAEKDVDELVRALEDCKVIGRVYVHVDLDAFFAAVEERDHPEYRGKPLAVGGMAMLSTANYVARKYGVSSAMPGYIAKKLCPDLIITKHNSKAYKEASNQARNVFAKYDPEFSSFSWDEASLDITGCLEANSITEPEEIEKLIHEMRMQITKDTNGLTCSAGIAQNRFLSKLCSNLKKPDGQFSLLEYPNPQTFILTQPIRKLWGVGKVTCSLLKGVLGVETCQELWDKRHLLPVFMTPAIVRVLVRCLLGLSAEEDPFENRPGKYSRSCETTFSPIFSPKIADVREILLDLSRDVYKTLEKEGYRAQNVGLKIKTADFEVSSRSKSIRIAVNDPQVFYDIACDLFKQSKPESVRLLGVRAGNLVPVNKDTDPEQSVVTEKREKIEDFFIPKPAEDESQPVVCPVCNSVLKDTSDAFINSHIDTCLNFDALKTVDRPFISSSSPVKDSPRKKPKTTGPMDKFIIKKS
jgi:DNA polymerase kappa